jgi:7,8-dihydropterin-6-yl-methyl-4-(beta-D-ribofuranosyl)aminobenzene 5'-phosphate synthase
MKLTIVYDNTTSHPQALADWGFACVIEDGDYKLLFDTGQQASLLLHNLNVLGIAPDDFDAIVLSHDDYDHRGGLTAMHALNPTAKIYLPYHVRCCAPQAEVHLMTIREELHPGIYSTGTFEAAYKKEQGLLLRTTKGITCVVGCSHPGLAPFVMAAEELGPLYALVGGFHGSTEYEEACGFQLVCPTHCTVHKTGFLNTAQTCATGGVGLELEL